MKCKKYIKATDNDTNRDCESIKGLDDDSKFLLSQALSTCPGGCADCKHLLKCAVLVALKTILPTVVVIEDINGGPDASLN